MNHRRLSPFSWILLALLVALPSARATTDGFPWHTDYEAALAEARDTGKPLLLKFTGSDWCPPCKRLNQEVFQTSTMRTYATDEIIAVYLDFPRRQELPEELIAQNAALAEEFGVDSYPTIWIVSPEGEPLGRLGYMEGGPKTFIRAIKRLLR